MAHEKVKFYFTSSLLDVINLILDDSRTLSTSNI